MKNIFAALYIVSTIALTACTFTKTTTNWTKTDTKVFVQKLSKILVVALLNNKDNSRKAEDQMVALLDGKGIALYNYVSVNNATKHTDSLMEMLKKDGFDGAITMRLIEANTPEYMSSYAAYDRTFSGYSYQIWPQYFNGRYYASTKTSAVETSVYSIKADKIMWTGLAQATFNVGGKLMTKNIVKAVYKEMIQQGFISSP